MDFTDQRVVDYVSHFHQAVFRKAVYREFAVENRIQEAFRVEFKMSECIQSYTSKFRNASSKECCLLRVHGIKSEYIEIPARSLYQYCCDNYGEFTVEIIDQVVKDPRWSEPVRLLKTDSPSNRPVAPTLPPDAPPFLVNHPHFPSMEADGAIGESCFVTSIIGDDEKKKIFADQSVRLELPCIGGFSFSREMQQCYAYFFFPFEHHKFPLLNGHLIKENDVVIITDSYETARINQRIVLGKNIPNIVWVSFYHNKIESLEYTNPLCPIFPVDYIDWLPLTRAKRVYFLVCIENIERDLHTYRDTANRIGLGKIIGSQLPKQTQQSYQFILCFKSCNSEYIDLPWHPTVILKRWDSFPLSHVDNYFYPSSLFEKCSIYCSGFHKNKPFYLSPIVYQQTTTLVLGDECATWLSLVMAFAISQGREKAKKAFTGWLPAINPINVFYLRRDDLEDSLTKKVSIVNDLFREKERTSKLTQNINEIRFGAIQTFFHSCMSLDDLVYENPNLINVTMDLSNDRKNRSKSKRLSDLRAEGRIAKLILECAKKFEKDRGNLLPAADKVMVLDNIFGDYNSDFLDIQHALYRKLRYEGWTIIVVVNILDHPRYRKTTTSLARYFDNVIKCSEKHPESTGLRRMNVRIHKAINWPLGEEKDFDCELQTDCIPPTFKRLPKETLHRPVEEKAKMDMKIRRMFDQNARYKDIAENLGIGLPYVKYRIREMGLSRNVKRKTKFKNLYF